MKIFGICMVKNEADIIELSLKRHSVWADKIFVYDNGSVDNTWEIVNNLAKTNDKIVPYKSEAKTFHDGLRAEVYNHYKHLASDGDWWCVRCDSDEFYMNDPRKFLKKVPFWYHVVLSLHYEYYLSKEDLNEIDFEGSMENILDAIKYYHPKVYSESRFIRHRNRLVWPENLGYPLHKGINYHKFLPLKHFQYRTPKQIQTRIETRKQARNKGFQFFKKDDVDSIDDIILPRSELIKESPEMPYKFKHVNWKPNALHRLLKFLLHFFKIFP